MNIKSFTTRLRVLMAKNNISEQEIAKGMGWNLLRTKKLLNGEEIPSGTDLATLSSLFSISSDALLDPNFDLSQEVLEQGSKEVENMIDKNIEPEKKASEPPEVLILNPDTQPSTDTIAISASEMREMDKKPIVSQPQDPKGLDDEEKGLVMIVVAMGGLLLITALVVLLILLGFI